MQITPKTMARQIHVAEAQRVERARVARVATRTRLAFTSETGVVRPQRKDEHYGIVVEDDPHCFVCGRHTDHFAEHDDMVEAGTARYGMTDGLFDGNVYPVPWHWDVKVG